MSAIDTSTSMVASVTVTHDNTYGAAFIGTVASAVYVTSQLLFANPRLSPPCSLFGVVCAQTYTYLNRYPLDRPFYKILVCRLRAFVATHMFLTLYFLRLGSSGTSHG